MATSPRPRCWQIWFLLRPLTLAYRWSASCYVLTCTPSVFECVQILCSCKDTSQIGLWPIRLTLFSIHPYEHSYILWYWGVGLQHMCLGTPFSHNTQLHFTYCLILLIV